MEQFAGSVLRHVPSFQPLLNKMKLSKNFLLHYPLQLQRRDNRVCLTSLGPIRKDSTIMFLNVQEAVLSKEMPQASALEKYNFDQKLKKISSKYEIMSDEVQNRVKILLQVLAGNLALTTNIKAMHRDLIFHLQATKERQLDKTNINSFYLMQLYNARAAYCELLYDILEKDFLIAYSKEQFFEWYFIVQKHIRELSDGLCLAPVLDWLPPAVHPNCAVKGLYLTHRRQSFIKLHTLCPIASGQELTLDYGKLGNHQLYLKHGCTIPDNPYTSIELLVDYEEVADILAHQIENKQQLLIQHNLTLRNSVVLQKGKNILTDDIKMLRIIFGDGSNDCINVSTHDQAILAFIRSQTRKSLSKIKVNPNRQSVIPDMVLIEKQEQEIMSAFN